MEGALAVASIEWTICSVVPGWSADLPEEEHLELPVVVGPACGEDE